MSRPCASHVLPIERATIAFVSSAPLISRSGAGALNHASSHLGRHIWAGSSDHPEPRRDEVERLRAVVFVIKTKFESAQALMPHPSRAYRTRWVIGVSSEGHAVMSVKVRPEPKDSGFEAREAPWRESKTAEPSDNMLERSMREASGCNVQ
jgi:hypothetical protein